jgi:hypothetical protein
MIIIDRLTDKSNSYDVSQAGTYVVDRATGVVLLATEIEAPATLVANAAERGGGALCR